MIDRRIVSLCVALSAASCDSPRESAAGGRVVGSAASPGAGRERSAPPAVARASGAATGVADEARVRAEITQLIAQWEAAQNGGDFETYRGLYAARFAGVRRSGDRVRRFDREGFLADRRRMFTRPMRVATSELVIRGAGEAPSAVFTQRWASGTYADEGPKRMVFVREGDALRIAVEEMLASRRLGELDAALELGTFVAFSSDAGTIALLAETADAEAEGPPTLERTPDPMIVGKRVGDGAPASVRALIGRTARVVAAPPNHGPATICEGKVDRVQIVRTIVPHFGQRQWWAGNQADPTAAAPTPPTEVAASAWDLGTHTYYAARIDARCEGAFAVTLVGAPEMAVFSRREPSQAEREALFAALSRTKRFAAHEQNYGAFRDALATEAQAELPAPPGQRAAWAADAELAVFEHRLRRVGTAAHRDIGCGQGFGGAVWAAFELGEGRPRELPGGFGAGQPVQLLGVFDVEGDGVLEAAAALPFTGYAIVRVAPRSEPLRVVPIDDLDCGC